MGGLRSKISQGNMDCILHFTYKNMRDEICKKDTYKPKSTSLVVTLMLVSTTNFNNLGYNRSYKEKCLYPLVHRNVLSFGKLCYSIF